MSYPALQDRAKSSKQFLLDTINSFSNIGGVILGCTELPMIIIDGDIDLPLFNTTDIHAKAVVDFALK